MHALRNAPAAVAALLTALSLAVVLAACGGAASPAPTPTPGPSGPPRTAAELKLALIHEFGALWYCDPDFYPLQRGEEIDAARERWAEVVADAEALAAILADQGLTPDAAVTDEEKLAVYRAWKVLNATGLDPIGNDRYRFDYLAQPAPGAAEGTRTAGIIDGSGVITVEQQAGAGEPMCPICLAADAMIETPDGPRAVAGLRIGDPVWTVSRRGARVEGVVIARGSTAVPAGHRVVLLRLADGRFVTASPGHPLADGRLLGDLRVGDLVAGSAVVGVDRVPYADAETFDIAVSGETGAYLVDGIALGSTLRP